jgi:hypothetical protein
LKWCDLSKVSLVEGQEPQSTIAGGEHDHRKIGQPQVERLVPIMHSESERILFNGQRANLKSFIGQIHEESSRRPSSATPADQVVHLGCDLRWNDQGSRFTLQQAANGAVTRVAGVSQCNQRSRVKNERQSPNPCSNSSSDVSATELPSPSQELVSANERCAVCCDSYAAMAARTISAWLRPSRVARRRKRTRSASSRYRLVFFMAVG